RFESWRAHHRSHERRSGDVLSFAPASKRADPVSACNESRRVETVPRARGIGRGHLPGGAHMQKTTTRWPRTLGVDSPRTDGWRRSRLGVVLRRLGVVVMLATASAIAAASAVAAPSSGVVGHLYVNDNTTGVNTVAGFDRH